MGYQPARPISPRPEAPPAMRAPSIDEISNFTMAAQEGDMSAVKEFIRRFPAHINAKDSNGYTALVCSIHCKDKNFDMVRFLIDKGMNPYNKTAEGKNAFHYIEISSNGEGEHLKDFMRDYYEEASTVVDEKLLELIKQQNLDAVRAYFDEEFYSGKKIVLTSKYLKLAVLNEDVAMARLLVLRGAGFSEYDLQTLKTENEEKYPAYVSVLKRAEIKGLSFPKMQVKENKVITESVVKEEVVLPEVIHAPNNLGDETRIPEEWKKVLAGFHAEGMNAVVCGGALRDLFNDRAIKDVDIFVKPKAGRKTLHTAIIRRAFHEAQVDVSEHTTKVSDYITGTSLNFSSVQKAVIKEGDSYGFGRQTLRSYVLSSKKSGTEYNIIFVNDSFVEEDKSRTYAQGLFSKIDFGICKIVYDGKSVIRDDGYISDVANKTITLTSSNDGNKSHLKRIIKKYPDWELCDKSKKLFPVKSMFFKKFKVKSKTKGLTSSRGPG